MISASSIVAVFCLPNRMKPRFPNKSPSFYANSPKNQGLRKQAATRVQVPAGASGHFGIIGGFLCNDILPTRFIKYKQLK